MLENVVELKNVKDLNLDKSRDIEFSNGLTDVRKILENIISSSSNYVIKTLDCDNSIKTELKSISKSFKTDSFKDILKTALASSVNIGLEILKNKLPAGNLLSGIANAAIKGGIGKLISTGIEIVGNKMLKNNLGEKNYITYFQDLITYFKENKFIDKFNDSIKRVGNKIEKFKNMCENWHEAYNNFNIDKVNEVYESINKYYPKVSKYSVIDKDHDIIKNLTTLINNKKGKLSQIQYDTCVNL